MPSSVTNGLLMSRPMGIGRVCLGRPAYLERSEILTRGGMTLETMVLMAFMKDQARVAPEAA